MLAATIFGALTAVAQVEYTDINPDTTISATTQQITQSYYVDFDQDAIYEKEIRHFNPGGMPAMVEIQNYPSPAYNTEEIVLSNGHAKVMQAGDTVGPGQSWGHDQYGVLDGPWYGGERYLATRFKKGTHWYYGWIRFSIPLDGSSFTMMDYAWNKTPDKGLLAGQPVATGIAYADRNHFSIQMDHQWIRIIAPQPGNFIVRLSDMNGRILKNITIKDSGNIDTDGLPAAIYVLTVSGAETVYSCKIQVW